MKSKKSHKMITLVPHDLEWKIVASKIIDQLHSILGDVVKDMEHIGSTAIRSIKAQPMIDIAIRVDDFNRIEIFIPRLKQEGFTLCFDDGVQRDVAPNEPNSNVLLHFVKSNQWKEYLLFRDYLNANSSMAKEYEDIKQHLASRREEYLSGKQSFIAEKLILAGLWDDFDRKFTLIEQVNKGWSSDKKYYAETQNGDQFLIRIADITKYENKKAEFKNMQRVVALGIPMQRPVAFGVCNDNKNVFLLLTWVEGDDVEEILPNLSVKDQYLLGVKAGEILKKMQSIEVNPPSDAWFNDFGKKIDRYIQNYRNCGLTFEYDEQLIAYIEKNRSLMKNLTTCLTHDDYHPGNMILNNHNELFIIDFQRLRMVEPYHALAGVQFSAKYSPYFAMGQINAYFAENPPKEFWSLLALYMACVAVNALPWSIPYGQEEIDFGYKQISDIFSWYDNFNRVVPIWYLKEFQIEFIKDLPFEIKLIEHIDKGCSSDRKYYIETIEDKRLLLRIGDVIEFDRKKLEYDMLKRVYELGVHAAEPFGFGLCNNDKNVYYLTSWLDGNDAENFMQSVSENEQFIFGLKAGEMLKKIHSLPAALYAEPWKDFFLRKVQKRIDFYMENSFNYPNGDRLINYLKTNEYLLEQRPQTFNHGDFNISNIIIMPDKEIGIIDFNAYNRDYGDPWWDLHSIVWDGEKSPHFCTGILQGYFNNNPPQEVYNLLLYYYAYDIFAEIEEDPENNINHLNNIKSWLESINKKIPTWYLNDFRK